MTSPYKTKPMANTVEMQIAEGCKSYDLYITSEFRRSMFVEGTMSKDDITLRISTLNMMYNKNREQYNKMIEDIKNSFESTSIFLEKRQFRNGLKEIMNLAKLGNRYIDQKEPWATIKTNKQITSNTLWVGANIISNLGVLVAPYLPKTSQKISKMFNFKNNIPDWKYREIKSGIKIENIQPLFKKIEKEK